MLSASTTFGISVLLARLVEERWERAEDAAAWRQRVVAGSKMSLVLAMVRAPSSRAAPEPGSPGALQQPP